MSITFSGLLHDLVHQLLEAVHMVIFYHARGDGCKEFFCAVYLRLFNGTQVQAVHGAFRFCHKVDMAHAAFVEHDRPVGRIVSYRRWNGKSLGQFRVNVHFIGTVQLFHKLTFHALVRSAVRVDVVLHRFRGREGILKGFPMLFSGKNAAVIVICVPTIPDGLLNLYSFTTFQIHIMELHLGLP